jgi:hypothetical protein
MTQNIEILTPGSNNTLINQFGEKVTPPDGWDFLSAGDAGLTRKVTSRCNYWRVQQKKGRRTFSKGIWAPAELIRQAQKEISETRETEEYKKKKEYNAIRRDKKQMEYKALFSKAIEAFLAFHEVHRKTEHLITKAVTEHAIPIGSGTVARTSMIPLNEKAARAVIAWMRHKTTAYDNLSIKRIKGERRRVRRLLAEQSVALLSKYREGKPTDYTCPLQKALADTSNSV